MKVKELMEILEDIPQDYEVVALYDLGHGKFSIDNVVINTNRQQVELKEDIENSVW